MNRLEEKIDKLNARNYSTWKTVLESLLKSKKLWSLCVLPDGNKEMKEPNEAEVAKNEEAKTTMYITMTAEQIQMTGVCEFAYELWERIRENHEGAEIDLRNSALSDFLSFNYRRGETIINYCGRFELSLAKLETLGQQIDEPTKFWVFKNTLPEDVKAVSNFWTMANPEGSIKELITSVKVQFHTEKRDRKEESLALYGRCTTSRPSNQTKPNKEKTIQCTYCKKDGHGWKECFKLKEDNLRKKKFGQKREQRSNKNNNKNRYNSQLSKDNQQKSGAFTANEDSKNYRFTPNNDHWIIDSGASSHMTNNQRQLQNYQQLDQTRTITFGDGKTSPAYGYGKVSFESGRFTGELREVLYVPDLKENLFSISKAIENGNEVEFTGNKVVIKKENRVCLIGGKTKNGLYTVKLKHISPPAQRDMAAVTIAEWHKRFGHSSTAAIKQLAKSGAVIGLKIDTNETSNCIDCITGKITRARHPTRKEQRGTEHNAVLAFDTCGPFRENSLGGSKYFVLAVEEYSNYKLIEFAKLKSEIPGLVRRLIHQTEFLTKRPVRMIRSDNGKEFVNRTIQEICREKDIIHETSNTYTPEQMGIVERGNRTIIEGIRTLLHDSKLPDKFWAEAANTVVYTSNRMLSPKGEKTRFELFFKRKPDVRNLRRFGQKAYVLTPDEKREGKLSPKGKFLTLIGYGSWNTYKFYDPDENTVVSSCNAKWVPDVQPTCIQFEDANEPETVTIIDEEDNGITFTKDNSGNTTNQDNRDNKQDSITIEEPSEINDPQSNADQIDDADKTELQEDLLTNQSVSVYDINNQSSSSYDPNESNSTADSSTISNPDRSMLTRSMGKAVEIVNKTIPRWFWDSGEKAEYALFSLDNEPRTIADAKASDEWDKWKQAMHEEMNALEANKTWTLVTRTNDMKTIKSKWIFKIKLAPNGNVERYKARLVAKGYSQVPNVDYKETFAPVASTNTVRLLLALANQNDMELLQFDIKTAFLYGDLDENIHMDYPDGFDNPGNKVCKLIKSLYGLKQAPRQWNKKFHQFLSKFKLNQSPNDKCLYFNQDRSLILTIYVDDGLVASNNRQILEPLIKFLKDNFEVKVMECEAYLGFHINRDRKKRRLKIQQQLYIDKVLDRFKMIDCKAQSTPEEVGTPKEDNSQPLTDEYPYKELVGSLLYLVTCTRPDIAHAVSVASRTSKPTQMHWNMLKRILRYLKGSRNIGIEYKWSAQPQLTGYSDADYANDTETRRSTTGYCILYGQGPIAWKCQRQPIVTLSTTEAEYVSGCELVKDLIPIREILIELKAITDEPSIVKIDNLSTVKIAKNDSGQHRTKHIDVRSKWLNEQVEANKIKVEHVSGNEQIADILTKPLHKTKFGLNRSLLLSCLSLICLTGVTDGHHFTEVNPIFFRPSENTYFSGDTEFNLTVIFMNPCEKLFTHELFHSQPNISVATLRMDCENYYKKQMLKPFENCQPQDSSVYEAYNETDLSMQDYISRASKKETQTRLEKMRIKRHPALAVVKYVGYSILVGQTIKSTVDIKNNEENIKSIIDDRNKQRDLLEESGKLFTAIRRSLHSIKDWSKQVEERLNILIDLNHDPSEIKAAAARVSYYLTTIKDYRDILDSIDHTKSDAIVNPKVRDLFNTTLWHEPASKWSTFYNCTTKLVNESLLVNFHFNMPIRDNKMKVMEAVHIGFYNQTKSPSNEDSVCWMSYIGPQYVLINTTNGCMTDTVSWANKDGSIRSQTCKGIEDQIRGDTKLFKEETCSSEVTPIKRRISDYEVNGIHRIYCYPFNITIENETYKCPTFVFEIEARKNFKVANFEHIGRYVEHTIMKDNDFHTSKTILQQLNINKIKINPINLTEVDEIHETFIQKLAKIPQNLVFTKYFSMNKLLEPISSLIDTAWSYVQTAGLIFAVIAGGFMLLLIAPVIEIAVLTITLLKIPLKLWKKSITRLSDKTKTLIMKHKKQVTATARNLQRNRRNMFHTSMALVFIITTLEQAETMRLDKVEPLSFRPSMMKYATGLKEIKLVTSLANPCNIYFPNENEDKAFKECNDLYMLKIGKINIDNCREIDNENNAWEEKIIEHKKMYLETKKDGYFIGSVVWNTHTAGHKISDKPSDDDQVRELYIIM